LQRTIGNQAVLRLLRARADAEARSATEEAPVAEVPKNEKQAQVTTHELTHVVQQTGATSPMIARQVGTTSTTVRFPSVSDDDIKWIDTLTKPPNILEQIDLGFSPTAELRNIGRVESAEKRDVARIEKTMKPGPDRDAAIEKARAAATTQTDSEKQRFQTGRGDRRKEFLNNMRILLGPDPATENHFKAFEPVDGSPGLFLHGDAAARMKEVRAELISKGHDIPDTTVGQALRGRHLGKLPNKGMLGHALGFSIDYNAYANPKISFEQGHERVAMTRLFSGGPTNIKVSQPNPRAFIEQLGKRTTAGEDVEKDVKVQAFLTEFEQQFNLMHAASDQFKQSLPAANLADLRNLKDRYEKALVDLRPVDSNLKALDQKITVARNAARKLISGQLKTKPADVPAEDIDAQEKVAKLLEDRKPLDQQKSVLEAEKEAVRTSLKTTFQPWLTKIQEKIDPLRAAETKAGILLDQIPSEAELNKAVNQLKNIDRLEKQLATVTNAKTSERLNDSINKLRAKIAPLLAQFDSAAGSSGMTPDGKPLSASVRLEQGEKFTEARLRRREIDLWASLAKNLTENTRFVFGDLEDGKSRLRLESMDPSVAQLLGLLDRSDRKTDEGGFFNPDPDTEKRGFNLLFFKTMVKHGFQPGATWQAGSTDPMHFDFVEGWSKLK